ncbi:MAG: PrgI family protein [Patescibacteria group bacterium]
MEYQVPQFIDVEDKIVGPLTFKQFLYLAGAAGLTVVCFIYLPFILAALLSLLICGFAAALAFYKVNGKPFVEILEAGFNYIVGAKLFLWRRAEPKVGAESVTAAAEAAAASEAARASRATPKLSRGKLSELAWSLDVNTNDSPQK